MKLIISYLQKFIAVQFYTRYPVIFRNEIDQF